jgi:hypothetical protein
MKDGLGIGLRALGVAKRCTLSLGALLATGAATEESDAILAVDCAHGEIALTRETKLLACDIDTHESVEVGSLHTVLLSNSWALLRGLHTTRRLLSIDIIGFNQN